LKEKVAAAVYKNESTVAGIRRTDHATHLYLQKLTLTSLKSCGRSFGIVHSWTQVTELQLQELSFRMANLELEELTLTSPYL
jgi:hypothetical protein